MKNRCRRRERELVKIKHTHILKRNKWSRVQKHCIYARIDVLKNIRKKLNMEQLELFKKSPFGSFLDLKIIKFQNQFVRAIMDPFICTLFSIHSVYIYSLF